jgi:hypothetical protein
MIATLKPYTFRDLKRDLIQILQVLTSTFTQQLELLRSSTGKPTGYLLDPKFSERFIVWLC